MSFMYGYSSLFFCYKFKVFDVYKVEDTMLLGLMPVDIVVQLDSVKGVHNIKFRAQKFMPYRFYEGHYTVLEQ